MGEIQVQMSKNIHNILILHFGCCGIIIGSLVINYEKLFFSIQILLVSRFGECQLVSWMFDINDKAKNKETSKILRIDTSRKVYKPS